MDQIELLCREHLHIAEMARALEAVVGRDEPPDRLVFLHLRREFGRTLTAHLKREDWVIYPRMFGNGRAQVREAVGRYRLESAAFSTAFSDYNRDWTSLGIVGDWSGFRDETLAILASLRRRMHVEDHELFPLLAEEEAAAAPHRRAG